jgi:hypothetical protein
MLISEYFSRPLICLFYRSESILITIGHRILFVSALSTCLFILAKVLRSCAHKVGERVCASEREER